MRFLFLCLFTLFFLASATMESDISKSIDLIVSASSQAKVGFCTLLACIMYNESIMLACKQLLQDQSDEYPDLLPHSKSIKSWHTFLLSTNDKFISYAFFV
jgi:hypothetical protein